MRIRKILWILTIAFIIILIWLFTNKTDKSNEWLVLRKEYMIEYLKNLKRFQKRNSSVCVLPSLNAFSPDILHYMKYFYTTCSVKRYGSITKNGWFIVSSLSISTVSISYIYRDNPKNIYINDDFAVKLSDPIYVKRDDNGIFKHKLEDDFIRVELNTKENHYVEFHAHINFRSQEEFKINAKMRKDVLGLGLDVVLLMIDSQSNANFHRQLLKSMPQLVNDEDTTILNGHTIVGDGTTAQLAAILIGEQEKNLPETRRNMPKSSTCDQFNFIFKDLHKAGYLTMLSEDRPELGTFHYRLNGFNSLPTSWYLRPFWLAQNPSAKCDVEYNTKLLKTFTETFEDIPKVSLIINADIGHNDFNGLQAIDDDIFEVIDFFKSPLRINHTVLIIFGDHGARIGDFRSTTQGKLEERLPFFSITLPPDFKKKYPKMFTALKKNSNVLTNHFDVYATLQHMLSYPDIPSMKLIGQSLFTEIDPTVRTCENSGVDDHWCPCLNYEAVAVTDETVKKIAHEVVRYLNNLLNENEKARKHCMKLTLQSILSSGLKTPKKEVSHFIKTNKNDECDSCGVVYDTSIVAKKYYEVVMTVYPSNGAFEVNADVLPDNTIVVDPNVSRINLYSNQPHCIMNEYPHLRPYCYCESQS
ncbi:uncharacterized protein LOC100208013 [Hydra vulgaris]|uniref:uncharacterized protein LOC100208013 n=1 Tax=Hydra vulgaris TaxID=6087 RepID=UPI001F5E664F|nr:uncharacterized protein LOC100208013 [Hydra vulgaris]